MSKLGYLKDLTNSLCLRDKGMRWNSQALNAIFSYNILNLCYIISDIDGRIDSVIGHDVAGLDEFEGVGVESALKDVGIIDDSCSIKKCLEGALAGSKSKCCLSYDDDLIHLLFQPLYNGHDEGVVGAMLILLRELGGRK